MDRKIFSEIKGLKHCINIWSKGQLRVLLHYDLGILLEEMDGDFFFLELSSVRFICRSLRNPE